MMKHFLVVAFLVAAATSAFGDKFKPAKEHGVVDEYIVVLADGVAEKPGHGQGQLPKVAQVAATLGQAHGGQVTEVWEHALQGFVIRMPEPKARKLADDPRVLSVEQNFWISAPVGDCYSGTAWRDTRTLPSPTSSPQVLSCSDPDPLNDTGSPTDPPVCRDNWGIDRTDQTTGRNGSYAFVNNGATVHAYIMDTGVRWSHREFLDATNSFTRVSGGVDARANPAVAGNATNTDDCYAHGTHVAGILAGRTFGIAKNAAIHPVRIIGCRTDPGLSNQEFADRVIRGLNWIVSDVISHRTQNNPWPSVVNWSGGNAPQTATSNGIVTAVQNVIANNIVLVQAAGNSSPDPAHPSTTFDACTWSMGGVVPDVIVAGGVDYYDGRWVRRPTPGSTDAQYCNSNFGGATDCGSIWGSCVDIWAPSTHIISSNNGDNDLTCQLSGTSMAAPHVSGAVAVYLQSNPAATPQQVERALRSRGTWGLLQSNPANPNYIGDDSDNVLLFTDTRSIGDTAPVASFSSNCPGRQCSFNALSSSDDGTITAYTWRFGDGTTATGAQVLHTFAANSTGNVVVLGVRDNTGKTDHLLRTVDVNGDAPPTAAFTYSCTATNCTFNSSPGSTDDGSIVSRSWTFGDGGTATGTTASHTYATGGSFTVVLTVTDNVGQTGTQSQTVAVNLLPPANVQASASGATVTITWTAAANADGYAVERKRSSADWEDAGSVSGGSTQIKTDTPPGSDNGVVLYRVRSKAGSSTSVPSNVDVAFVATFTDDPVAATPPLTAVKAVHITEVRSAVNGLLDLSGHPPLYSAAQLDPNNLRGQLVDDDHFVSLMQNLNTARSYFAMPDAVFRSPAPAASVTIFRSQIEDLRLAVK